MSDAIKRFIDDEERVKKLIEGSDMSKMIESLTGSHVRAVAGRVSIPVPRITPLPRIPTPEDKNNFQSAGVLLRRLAQSIGQWRSALPDNVQPAIIAILHGGVQIEVDRLAQESFHGIRIEGRLKDSPCMVLAHQGTIQLLCYVQQVQPPDHPRKSIGFVIDGEESEA